jgi:hypothetical protein
LRDLSQVFNRNDNRWEHYWTHVHRPGKKQGRNAKYSLRRVLTYISDLEHIDKLYTKWRNKLHYDYNPETDPQVLEEAKSDDERSVKEEPRSMSPLDVKEVYTIHCKV